MKVKHIESRYPDWFIFGEHPDGVRVDIADTHGDIATGVPKDQALFLIGAHNQVTEALINAVQRLSSEEQDAWLQRNNPPKP